MASGSQVTSPRFSGIAAPLSYLHEAGCPLMFRSVLETPIWDVADTDDAKLSERSSDEAGKEMGGEDPCSFHRRSGQ